MRTIFTSIILLFVVFNTSDIFGVDNHTIHEAALHGNLELMKQLKDQGADVNAKHDNGETLMH